VCVFFPARHLNFGSKRDEIVKDPFVFITPVLSLLEEDGWLSPLAQEGFLSVYGDLNLQDHLQKRLNTSLSGMPMHRTYLQWNQYRTSMVCGEKFFVASSIKLAVSL
jgi:hypothetical protein